jgi:hypothetical protein
VVTGPEPPSEDLVAAVLRLADLAAKVERAEASARRLDAVARDCAEALAQIAQLRRDLGSVGGRADAIEQRLADIGGVLGRMAEQITGLAGDGDGGQPDRAEPYTVNPSPPWWRAADQRCGDTTERLAAWVEQVYRPVFGYLADLLAPCWAQHPLCLAYLDTLHEAWCLLYLTPRDPKMVFAQLDWLTRPLLQAAEVMAADTRACRERGHHQPPALPHRPGVSALPRQ